MNLNFLTCFSQNLSTLVFFKKVWIGDTELLIYPADTDVFKTSSGLLKKVTTSCDQTRRRHELLIYPADTDVFMTSSGRLKKVTTSCDQTRRRHDVWKKTSDLRRLEDV